MKYLQVVIFLVAVISVLSQNNDTNEIVDTNDANDGCANITKEERDFDFDADEENPFVKEFNKEKSPIEVADALEKRYKISMWKVFAPRSWKHIHVRSNLPYVKQHIAGRIEQFHKLDLETVFQLLGKIGQVLRVAYAGCKSYNCAKSVVKLMGRYQDLITNTTRLSKYMVNRCILSLNYHKKAYIRRKRRDSALFQFNKTIPVALKIKSDSQKVVDETEYMRDLSKLASKQANQDLAGSTKEKKEYDDRMKKLEDDHIIYTEEVDKLKKQVDDYRKRVDKFKAEEAKIDTAEEYERKKSVLSLKCKLIQTPRFKEICQSVMVLFVNIEKCKLHTVNSTEQDCRNQLDRDLLEARKDELAKLAKRRKEVRDQRLVVEEKKLEVQLMQRNQFAELQKTGARLTMFRNIVKIADHNLGIARTSLELADRSMIIVQTQLKKMVDFWDNVVKHTTDIVREARDNIADDDIEGLREKILASGFSWMALAKVLRIAALEMRKTTYTVDDAFMNFPTTKEVRAVISGEAKQILDATVALASKYEERIRETENKIKVLHCRNKTDVDIDNLDGDGDIDEDGDDFNIDDIDMN